MKAKGRRAKKVARNVPLKNVPLSMRSLYAMEGFMRGRQNLADAIDASYTLITSWHNRKEVPAKYILKLVEVSGGRFCADDFLQTKAI